MSVLVLFGIGGGTVLTPIFLSILPYFNTSPAVVMHAAVATSLALIIPTAIASSREHYRLGHLEVNILSRWVPAVVIGVIFGAICIHFISSFWLKIFFTAYLFVCFLFAIFKKESSTNDGQGPKSPWRDILGLIVGFLSTLLGIGGGTFTVPIFMMSKYPLKKAIALSAATGFFIGSIGALVIMITSYGVQGVPKYSLGYVNLLAFIAVTPTAMFASPIGARIANKIEKNKLRMIYGVFLLLVFLFMIFKLVTHYD